MRIAGCTLASLLVAAPLIAQQPPAARPTLTPVGQSAPGIPAAVPSAAPALNPNDPLDTLLLQWEQKMKSVESLTAQCVRTETDPLVANKVEEYKGWAKFQRPSRAHLYMEKKSNPQIYERYLSTGTRTSCCASTSCRSGARARGRSRITSSHSCSASRPARPSGVTRSVS